MDALIDNEADVAFPTTSGNNRLKLILKLILELFKN
jgi:hypothetical protein